MGEDLDFLRPIGFELMRMLSESRKITLTLIDKKVALISDKQVIINLESTIDDLKDNRQREKAWIFINNILKRLTNIKLPEEMVQLKDLLAKGDRKSVV